MPPQTNNEFLIQSATTGNTGDNNHILKQALLERLRKLQQQDLKALHEIFEWQWQQLKQQGLEAAATTVEEEFQILPESYKALLLVGASWNASSPEIAWSLALLTLAAMELESEAKQKIK